MEGVGPRRGRRLHGAEAVAGAPGSATAMARVPVREWSALTRDIVALVLNYCRRHVLHGRVHVDRVDGGVEVVFRIHEHLPIARHASRAGATDRPTSRK